MDWSRLVTESADRRKEASVWDIDDCSVEGKCSDDMDTGNSELGVSSMLLVHWTCCVSGLKWHQQEPVKVRVSWYPMPWTGIILASSRIRQSVQFQSRLRMAPSTFQ